MSSEHPIILYQYKLSIFAKRVHWYLQLRGIPYKQTVSPRSSTPDPMHILSKYTRNNHR